MIKKDLVEKLQVFTEKKNLTREDRNVYRFKKKYHFKPDKPGSNKGTITVDGKKYRCNLNYKSFVDTDSQGNRIHRVVSAEKGFNKDDILHIDRHFFNLKNDDRRHALLLHEVGHTVSSLGYKNRTFKGTDSYQQQGKFRKHAEKYALKDVDHANVFEMEADRYAVNHSSKKAFKKGLAEYTKKNFSKADYKHSNNFYRKEKKRQLNDYIKKGLTSPEELIERSTVPEYNNQRDHWRDFRQRSKALDDPKLRDNVLYQKDGVKRSEIESKIDAVEDSISLNRRMIKALQEDIKSAKPNDSSISKNKDAIKKLEEKIRKQKDEIVKIRRGKD